MSSSATAVKSSLNTKVALLFATWFGCGYFPVGPGTVGSLGGIAIAILLQRWFTSWHLALTLAIVLVLIPGIWSATETARYLKRKDPGIVVVDEVLGQWVTLVAAPTLTWKTVLAGFVLFRLFDIWKPWPVRQLEELPQGIGIIADDLAAGAYGALILYTGVRLSLL